MQKGRCVMVVGHKHWGKSKTLRALTGNLARSCILEGDRYQVRRMSNDDDPEGLEEFFKKLDPTITPSVIAAFCPNFEGEVSVRNLLGRIGTKYHIAFWVQLNAHDGVRQILPEEVEALRKFGEVMIYPGRGEGPERARHLRSAIDDFKWRES